MTLESIFIRILSNVDSIEVKKDGTFEFVETPQSNRFSKDIYINLTDLKEFLNDRKRLQDNIEKDFIIILETLGITQEDVLQKSKKSELVIHRQFVHYYLRHLGYNFSKIGTITQRDHSTVMNSVKAINNILELQRGEYYPLIMEYLNTLENN